MRTLLRKLTLRRRLEREMRDELEFHVRARAADLAGGGLPPREAERQARIELGGIERYREELRDARRFGLAEDFARDLAYAWRNLRRSPVFTLSAAGAVALGIGVNAALFSLVYGVLFRPLPVRDPATIRNVYMSILGNGDRSSYGDRWFVSFAEFGYMRAHARTADLAGVAEAGLSARFAPAGLHAQLASDNLLPLTGAVPALGRFFTREEASTPGSAAVAVLSYDAWRTYFNGENVAGRNVTLNRMPFTIVGVAGPGFYGPLVLKADLWIPLSMQAITRAGEPLIDNPSAAWIQVLGRRAPGIGDAGMRAEMEVLGHQALSAHAPTQRALVTIAPGAFLNYPDVKAAGVPIAGAMLVTVSLVLLVACANVANMLVARGFGRGREIAIRLSIGAAKGRLVRQLLTEHMLLGLFGGMGGLVLSQLAVRTLLRILPVIGANQLDVSPDWTIALWTLLVALAAGVVFGLPAALAMTRGDLTRSLRGDALEAHGKHRRFRLQSALIAIQVAVSALLLINSGLLVRAAGKAVHLDAGEAVDHVLVAYVNLRDLQYTPQQAERYFHELRERAAALPGVSSAAWTGFEPLMNSCGTQVKPVQQDGAAKTVVPVNCNEAGPEFLRVMRIPLRQGRQFEPADERSKAKVVIVDEEFARRYLPGNPLGRRVRFGNSADEDHEVVGVAASTHSLNFVTGDHPQVYRPLEGLRFLEARLVVAYDGPRAPLVRALESLGPQLDRDVNVRVKPIEDNVSLALGLVRLAAGGVGALGGLALLLACTGVYGVVAFTVGRRRREIGVRMALGAQAASVMRLLTWQSLRPVAIGCAIGTALAAAASQLIRAMLYGISPLDPLGFAGALAVLAAVAAVAALIPASAALRVDPAAALRHE